MEGKIILRPLIITVAVLAVPLIAMQFTADVQWDLFDFVIMGILIFGAGLSYELISRQSGAISYRAGVGLSVLTGLVLIWMNLAVGIIGSEDNPANALYLLVLATGLFGAFMARFKPKGMAKALFATAIMHALVPCIAFVIWRPEVNGEMIGVVILNGIFVLLWVTAGILFQRADEVK